MQVQVKLYASLRKYRPELGHGEAASIELCQGATVRGALDALGVPEDDAKQCFVNGVVRDLDHALQEGDEMGVFPPIAGGQDAES